MSPGQIHIVAALTCTPGWQPASTLGNGRGSGAHWPGSAAGATQLQIFVPPTPSYAHVYVWPVGQWGASARPSSDVAVGSSGGAALHAKSVASAEAAIV